MNGQHMVSLPHANQRQAMRHGPQLVQGKVSGGPGDPDD